MQYRRAHVPGGTYFFTVNLAERSRTLLVNHIDDLRNAVQKMLTSHPFRIDAMVVLPDHLHAIWTLPEGDADYPMRWSLVKAGFSRCIPADERRSKSRIAKGERGIWQRRYWEQPDPGRAGLHKPCELHPLQPGQTRSRYPRCGLAVFDIPPGRQKRAIPA